MADSSRNDVVQSVSVWDVLSIVIPVFAIVCLGIWNPVRPEYSRTRGCDDGVREVAPVGADVGADKARIAAEKYDGIIATPEAYEEVFGPPSIADTKYEGIIATPEAYQEVMRENKDRRLNGSPPEPFGRRGR